MTENQAILAISRRPDRLSDLCGQEKLVSAIRKQMASRPPHAWLFSGPTGCGKTTVARILALAFQCQHQKAFGDPCDECISRRRHFDIVEINASEVNGVEDLGQVAITARYQPLPPSLKRVFILDEAQRMTTAAQNLLLKPFEDCPPGTVWIICTTEPSKILATLRRRCMSYAISPLALSEREKFLSRAARDVRLTRPLEPLIDIVHQAGISTPGLLLMALEKYASGLSPVQSVASEAEGSVNSLAICKSLTSGDWPQLRDLLQSMSAEESRWIRASVVGWLRGWVLNSNRPSPAALKTLGQLTDVAPYDDPILFSWLVLRLYHGCIRFRAEKQESGA